MELIPGLPEDLACECLSRVPYQQFPAVGAVCKEWKAEIESPGFLSQRKSTGQCQVLVVLVQARPNPIGRYCSSGLKNMHPPIFLPTVFEPLSGQWVDLPPPPGCCDGLPRFCRLAAVRTELVVVGGLDPVTWDATNSVYVYSFLTSEWRRGADMPGGDRFFFGCASEGDRFVFVAGGHDKQKNSLRSAMAYDVHMDRWVQMPDMARERDECRGAFRGGKFLVISGYGTEAQGKFDRSVEAFDAAMWSWDPVEENVLEADTAPRACVDGQGDDALYTCRNRSRDIAALRGSTWTPVAGLPSDVASQNHVMRWRWKLLVFGYGSGCKPDVVSILDLCDNNTWTELEIPEEFRGTVDEGCVLEI
ncbi:F-box/kelch-repeat protein At1g15670-like [Punica granatum]|uniref:F-box domain-containing protein n=2 Tax=Punica granatum TaxID=22663 RepID=A0A218W053_PUNGR|nr:F-box/kelch-repeat protein At1g15670-like [Punica granatum]OWM66135.1 hypothetical protein CDL15_Pgr015562 [Punica granatum]PKI71107.1 hypothetical protein CRG98_008508 [Punica granatum]